MYGNTRDASLVPWKPALVSIVAEFAREHDIQMTLLSGDWIILLEKDGVRRHIFGVDFSLNSSTAKLFARDKVATTDVLIHLGIPCMEHRLFLRPTSRGANPYGNWDSLITWFKECNGDVVCKPNTGSGGDGVVRAQTQAELEAVIQNLFIEERAIAVAPYMGIESEYRATILNDIVELSYEKVRDNETDFKFNLGAGARPKKIENEELRLSIEKLAQRAARAIDITFSNVDIIRTKEGLHVIEINSGVAFEHYAQQGEKERRETELIYNKALKSLFAGVI